MSKITVITFDPPYGKQRMYNALRFVLAALFEGHSVNLFLMEDSILAAKTGQNPQELPAGKDFRMPNCEAMLREAIKNGATVMACGACAMERGIRKEEVIEGVTLATILDLVEWVDGADKVITF